MFMNNKIKGKFRVALNDFKSFLGLFKPEQGTEIVLFLSILFFYLTYSIYIAINSSILDNSIVETDLYFSYDTPLILKYGRTQLNGHPLLFFFYYPFVIIGNGLAYILGYKAKTLFFVVVSSILTSMSCIYIYRYINKIIELNRVKSILFALFFAFFSTNLILCFTPESFNLSAFFLSFSVYYYSYYIKINKTPSFIPTILLTDICLGGVTITNVVKGIIPVIFLNEKKTKIFKRIFILTSVFILILLIIQLFMYFTENRNYLNSIVAHQQTFTSITYDTYPTWKQIFHKFFGTPIFFSEIINNTFFSNSAQRIIRSIDVIFYEFIWQKVFIYTLVFLLIFSLIKNFKNKYVQMLFLLLFTDIVIHCVLRFGLDWPFMYGAHWVYCIPLLLAWLYKSLEIKLSKVCFAFLSVTLIILFANNLIRLFTFIEIAKEMFPQ